MTHHEKKYYLILVLVGSLLLLAVSDGISYFREIGSISLSTNLLHFLPLILLVLWIDADSRDYPQISLPFDRGFLLWLFWLPYLPYYLWRTRGPKGLLMFAGFLLLFFGGYLVYFGIYLTLPN